MIAMEFVIPPLLEVMRRIPPIPALGSLVLGGVALWAISSPTPPLYINITTVEYQRALTKWQALGIREYEATITKNAYESRCEDGCIVHVRTDGHKAELVDDAGVPGVFGMSKVIPRNYVQDMTIESMFDNIYQFITSENSAKSTKGRAILGGMSYTVSFKEDMGHPESIEARLLDDPINLTQWLGVSAQAKENWTMHVNNVTVITSERK